MKISLCLSISLLQSENSDHACGELLFVLCCWLSPCVYHLHTTHHNPIIKQHTLSSSNTPYHQATHPIIKQHTLSSRNATNCRGDSPVCAMRPNVTNCFRAHAILASQARSHSTTLTFVLIDVDNLLGRQLHIGVLKTTTIIHTMLIDLPGFFLCLKEFVNRRKTCCDNTASGSLKPRSRCLFLHGRTNPVC